MLDFEFAKDKVMMGAERRSMIITDEEKKVTAVHEAGHALVAVLLPERRSGPQGHDHSARHGARRDDAAADEDKHNYTREYLNDWIAMMMGGRIAEELTFNSMTTGAGNDIERATELARKMVCEWGMSEAMGPLTFGKKEEQIFLGREIAQHQDYSEDTAIKIDKEVKRIVTDNYTPREGAHRPSTRKRWAGLPTRCSCAKCSTPSRCAAWSRACRSKSRRSRPVVDARSGRPKRHSRERPSNVHRFRRSTSR